MNRSDHRSDSCLKMFENYINAILMSESVFIFVVPQVIIRMM